MWRKWQQQTSASACGHSRSGDSEEGIALRTQGGVRGDVNVIHPPPVSAHDSGPEKGARCGSGKDTPNRHTCAGRKTRIVQGDVDSARERPRGRIVERDKRALVRAGRGVDVHNALDAAACGPADVQRRGGGKDAAVRAEERCPIGEGLCKSRSVNIAWRPQRRSNYGWRYAQPKEAGKRKVYTCEPRGGCTARACSGGNVADSIRAGGLDT